LFLSDRSLFLGWLPPAAVEEYPGLQEWFQVETEKCVAMIKHRHNAEVEAFTEQLRLKDEKLEAFRWRAVTMDVEAARLPCRIQDTEARLAQQEQHSAGLEAMLLDREKENRALKEQLEELKAQKSGVAVCAGEDEDKYADDDRSIPCSSVKMEATDIIEAERLLLSGARHQDGTEVTNSHHAVTTAEKPISPHSIDKALIAAACGVPVPDHGHVDAATSTEPEPYGVPARHSFRCEIEGEKAVYPNLSNAHSQEAVATNLALAVVAPPQQKPAASACKTDIHALAVSYKIKRLKQQLAVLEKLAASEDKEDAATAAKPSDSEASSSSSSGRQPRSRFHTMMSFLSKHVERYQSLDDKIDDLGARMVSKAPMRI
jgi:hypothetical protein